MDLEHIEVGAFCNLRQISTLNLNENKLQTLPEKCVKMLHRETIIS